MTTEGSANGLVGSGRRRRVVVTGLGLVTPLACGVEASWSKLIAGEKPARRLDDIMKLDDVACKIGCIVPRGQTKDGMFNPDDWLERKEQRRVDPFIIYAVSAGAQALTDADWHPETDEQQARSGVLIGSGIGGLTGISDTAVTLANKGARSVSPFFVPGRLINLAGGYVSIRHKLKGPNSAVVTACSSGTHAIGDAARLIASDDADVMVAGGAESAVCRIGMAGFAACRALSTNFNDRPQQASRPYDKDRDGFVMGEGAGCVVLEEYEHALARGARIYAEIIGYGLSGDAYHITAPSSDGDGAYRCMRAAITRAGISTEEIDYINAHGTSTPLGDEIELRAVERVLGDAASGVLMSSTKSTTGHLLGAAGAVEAVFSVMAINRGIVPATNNLDNQSVATDIDLVPHQAREAEIKVAMSNSFGFGGSNATVIFRKV